MENFLIFITPFIIPFGIFILSSTIESITKYGQVLAADEVLLPVKGFAKVLWHYSKLMHHFYLACFAYDLSALVSFVDELMKKINLVSYHSKSQSTTLILITLSIIISVLAYIHTLYINTDFEKGKSESKEAHVEFPISTRAKRPATYLNLVYGTISLALIIAIRW